MENLKFENIIELENELNKYCDRNTSIYTSIGVVRESRGLIHCVTGHNGFKVVTGKFNFELAKYEYRTWEVA